MIKVDCYYENSGTWTLLDKCHYPIDITKRFDETLDSGAVSRFVESETETELLPELVKIKIVVSEYNSVTEVYDIVDTLYFCGNEKRNRLSKFIYKHTLNLVEITKLIEGYIIDGKAVTQPLTGTKKTIKDVLEELLLITPFRRISYASEEQVFYLDSNLSDRLSRKESPEFRWSCKSTLWDCFSEAGKYITAIPRLIPDAADDTKFNTITYDFLDEVKNNILTLLSNATESYRGFDENQYCSELEAVAENIIAKNEQEENVIYFPAKNATVRARTDQIRLTDSNCQVHVLKNIYKIKKVLITNMFCGVGSSLGDLHFGYKTTPTDITDFVVSEDLWDTLNIVDNASMDLRNLYKNNTLYYEGDKIYVITDRYKENAFSLFSVPAITNVINSALVTYDEEFGKLYPIITVYDGTNYYTDPYYENSFASDRTPEIEYYIEFVAENDQTKIRTVKIKNQSQSRTLNHNQSAETYDSKSLGKNMIGKCERLGGSERIIIKNFSKWTDLPQIGDIYENYIITEISTSIRSPNLVIATLKLSRDYNKLSEYVNIDAKYRQWKIPNNRLILRNLYYHEYCEIAETASSNTSWLSDLGVESFSYVLKTNVLENSSVTNLSVNARKSRDVTLPVSCMGTGNSLLFQANTQDNLSAGKKVTSADSNNNCIDVYYSLKDGTMPYASFFCLGNTLANPNPLLFPESYAATGENYNNISRPLTKDALFYVKKDAAEILYFTYQIHFISELQNIIIGEMLYVSNPLVIEQTETKIFKLYTMSYLLPKFATNVNDYGIPIEQSTSHSMEVSDTSVLLSVNLTNGLQTDKSWAITDTDGNIYIAENNNAYMGSTRNLYFNFKNKR